MAEIEKARFAQPPQSETTIRTFSDFRLAMAAKRYENPQVATVLLSYRHDTSEHSERVRKLGMRLRDSGLQVVLDQFAQEEEFNMGGPPGPNGWARWSYTQVDAADKVAIIGSVGYFRVYEDREKPGVGLGAAVEAQRIFSQLYDQKGHNPRFRVVVLHDGDDATIPDHLSGYHRFHPNSHLKDFDDLVQWLKGVSRETLGLSSPAVARPSRLLEFKPDLANRETEFELFESTCSDSAVPRALLLEAPGNHGKTCFLAECMRYGRMMFGPDNCVIVDFKGNPSKEFALDTLRLELASLLPNFRKTVGTPFDLRGDLRALHTPIALLFDTYEKASVEARELVEGLLLADLEKLPAVTVVIAGRIVPDHSRALWANAVRHVQLGPITNPLYWRHYAQRHYEHLTAEHIEAVTLATEGIPGVLRPMLQIVETGVRLK